MRGPRAPALALAAALVVALLASPAPVRGLRGLVFDGYQRLFPLERKTTVATIVAIDEASLARYGQWPWPRTRVARLIEAIGRYEPAAIGLDLFFPEPDRFSPGALAAELLDVPAPLAAALARLASSDDALARAIRGRHVVLGIAGTDADPRFARAPRAAPVVVAGGADRALDRRAGHIGNLPVLDAAAQSRGLMDATAEGGVVRRVPMVRRVQGVLVPALGVETLRVAEDGGLALAGAGAGLLRLRVGPHEATIQDDGTAWLRASAHDPQRFVSALDVIEARADPALLRGKAVLVGIDGLGLRDYKLTPLGQQVPGVEIHAQVIENLFDGVRLARPAYASRAEAAALAALALLLAFVVPQLAVLRAAQLVSAAVLGLAAAGLVAFRAFGVLLDAAGPAIGTLAVFGTLLAGSLSEAQRQRRQLREQAARMAGEVDAARRIQMGLLPDPAALAPDARYAIAAWLAPARSVGGDFYDFFALDARRLFLAVADVSGKGLASALFMAAAKSQIRSAALRGGTPGEILTRAEEAIARENPEQLFVTAFVAILDLPTGRIEYANAGHEPPFRRAPRGPAGRFDAPDGPPLGVIEGFAHRTRERVLAPGEWVLVFTDGATEAVNRAGEFFGIERLRASVAGVAQGAAPAAVLERVRADLDRFAAGAELADDVTLLALRWSG